MTRGAGYLFIRFASWLLIAGSVAFTALPIVLAQEAPKSFVLLARPMPMEEITFNDAEGHAHRLTDFRGKVMLLNIWATWCIPCRTEMPALDRLQSNMGGANFEIVPVSIDRSLEAIRKFYGEIGIRNLAMYIDSSGEVLRQVRALGLPTTLLIDRRGQEIGRVIGPEEWDRPDIVEFLKPFIADKDFAVNQAGDSQPSHNSLEAPGLLNRGLKWIGTLLGR